MKTLISLFLLVAVTGCATRPVIVQKDASLTQAAAISDRIDAKAVVVEQWLRSRK